MVFFVDLSPVFQKDVTYCAQLFIENELSRTQKVDARRKKIIQLLRTTMKISTMRKVAIGVMSIALAVAIVPAVAGAQAAVVPVPINTFGNNLGSLYILGTLFNGSDMLGVGGTNLGDLFILNSLFSGTGVLSPYGTINGAALGNAFALDALFNGTSNGLLSTGGTTIGDMFLLNQLFR